MTGFKLAVLPGNHPSRPPCPSTTKSRSLSERVTQVEIKTLKDKERELLLEVLTKTSWNLEKTSRLMQIPVSEVRQKIREHGMTKPDSP